MIFPLLVGLVVLGLAVNTLTSEAGALRPGKPDATIPVQGQPLLTEKDGVWLVRLGLSERVPLKKLADEVTFKYGVPVGVLPEIAQIPGYAVEADGDALKGDSLFLVLRQWYVAEEKATIIGITDYPMTSDVLDLRRPFMLRGASRYGVISTAELGAGPLDRLRGHTRYERTRKLVGRAIGFIYLHRPVSSDANSLLRSRMSGTGDIDALDERL